VLEDRGSRDSCSAVDSARARSSSADSWDDIEDARTGSGSCREASRALRSCSSSSDFCERLQFTISVYLISPKTDSRKLLTLVSLLVDSRFDSSIALCSRIFSCLSKSEMLVSLPFSLNVSLLGLSGGA